MFCHFILLIFTSDLVIGGVRRKISDLKTILDFALVMEHN